VKNVVTPAVVAKSIERGHRPAGMIHGNGGSAGGGGVTNAHHAPFCHQDADNEMASPIPLFYADS
jgi:hypothetical protein